MKLRFDEVLYDLERERLRVEDLRRLADVAAHLRSLLPTRRRQPSTTAPLHRSALADFLRRIEARVREATLHLPKGLRLWGRVLPRMGCLETQKDTRA